MWGSCYGATQVMQNYQVLWPQHNGHGKVDGRQVQWSAMVLKGEMQAERRREREREREAGRGWEGEIEREREKYWETKSVFRFKTDTGDKGKPFRGKNVESETSLVVLWLGLHTSNARGRGLTPGWETKIPYVKKRGQKRRM